MITFNKDPLSIVKLIAGGAQPTRDLADQIVTQQKTRILDRTKSGKNFEDKPFVEYSKNGPIYFYPSGKASGRSLKSRQGAANRLFSKITGKKASAHKGKGKALSGDSGEAWVTPGGGLGFSSYAALKKWAGRNNVDLRGLQGNRDHMLNSMLTKTTVKGKDVEGIIGIYGAPAARAEGHNKGTKHLPQRKFLAASKKDEKAMVKIVERFVQKAVKAS
jgi:phage gpG-like protein